MVQPRRLVDRRRSNVRADHYADTVCSEPGQCWWMISNPDGAGRPKHCPEPIAWVGDHRLAGGNRIRVWTCDGHLEGVENPERVSHRYNARTGAHLGKDARLVVVTDAPDCTDPEPGCPSRDGHREAVDGAKRPVAALP
jgi:hypothetical protein